MNLPDFLLPDSPYRNWVMALGACIVACLPPATRRLGGILFFVIAGVGAIYFFLNDAFRTFAPSG